MLIGNLKGFLPVVGDDDRSQIESSQDIGKLAPNSSSCGGIERRERFIKQQQLRVCDHGAGESDSLLLPTR